ncbi:hypothetical protein [Streptomyces sp. c-19]|uniref:hypothetical protein n=1 Tax=Streptomyces sp. c-19 TaxID=2789275 RepID=UPI00397F0773
MAELFWEQAPEFYSRWLPAEVSVDMLLRWGFTEDGTHLFWLMTGNDSAAWPIADLYEDGGPLTIHEDGFAAYVRRWCTPASGRTEEAMQFIHWREYDPHGAGPRPLYTPPPGCLNPSATQADRPEPEAAEPGRGPHAITAGGIRAREICRPDFDLGILD